MQAAGQARARSAAGERVRLAGNGLGHAQIADLQRVRIVSAMFDVAGERGAANVTVAHVVARSGVSRRTFYELFDDREDCLLAAFDEGIAYAAERVLPAYRCAERWQDRIRASLAALLRFIDEEPAIGRLLVVESLAAGPRVVRRRDQVLSEVVAALDEGREQSGKAAVLPLTAEGVLGGVLWVLHGRLAEHDPRPLVELAGPLMSMIVMPYLGSAAARRELARPVNAPHPEASGVALLADPFKKAGMRLTYRTVRVLLAIADHPLASNRLAGELAGVPDQGQISKLLARLERAHLISNAGLGPGQGAPNEWSLTPAGRQMANSIRAHTESPQGLAGGHGVDHRGGN